MNGENQKKIGCLLQVLKGYSNEVVEASVIRYVTEKRKISFFYEGELSIYEDKVNKFLLETFEAKNFPLSIEFITELFESLLDKNQVIENGIVFTPEYIATYIYQEAVRSITLPEHPRIIDPSCGCGIFLAVSAQMLHERTGRSYQDILKNSIYGIELDEDNARRCRVVLNLLPILHGKSNRGVSVNILCADSLKNNLIDFFGVQGYDLIIGNPPYVNTHDMSKDTTDFLKGNFLTTKSGVYNIFYAFIEHAYSALCDGGMISYIVPNNFLTIISATGLRKFIVERKSLRLVLDFAENMIFKPVRTYNCILQLTKQENSHFDYCVMEPCGNIEHEMKNIVFDCMSVEDLDIHGWKLVDKKTRHNIKKIESQAYCIKDFIRTGIATLKDEVYIVSKDAKGFFKIHDGKRYDLEPDLIKRLYKIPELKGERDLESICRYIIFPYKKGPNGAVIIHEDEIRTMCPNTYAYLLSRKGTLDARDKGKPNPVAWYAYGRTQGLNRYGIKLLFPTFADVPRFLMVDDVQALFCNGYGVLENNFIELDILQKVLNSSVMQYYVSHTSYAIEGGYYCYQKKYIERFSIPLFEMEEKRMIQGASQKNLDDFLIKKYKLEM